MKALYTFGHIYIFTTSITEEESPPFYRYMNKYSALLVFTKII